MELLQNGVGAATLEGGPCKSYSSDLQNVNTGQKNLWEDWAESSIVFQTTVCKDTRKADTMSGN